MDINAIKGVGDKTLQLLKKLNVTTIEDVLTYYPYRYTIYKVSSLIESDEAITIKGIVDSTPQVSYIRRNLNSIRFKLNTNGLLVNVVIFNRAFLKNHLTLGRCIHVVGKYNKKSNTFTASDIKFEMIQGTMIEPVYHLVSGITNKNIGKIIQECLKMRVDVTDYIPSYLVEKYQFVDKLDAIKELHMPTSSVALKKSKLRLIYEEFFVFMFKTNYLRYKYINNSLGLARSIEKQQVAEFINQLPFSLTADQIGAIEDVYQDLTNPRRMNRLLLGDVGSGKTIISIIAMYMNALSGYQSALMTPTEILATQHYGAIKNYFKNSNLCVALLVGSMKKKEKEQVTKEIEDGTVNILIGTHALLSEQVTFKNLGLVVTDEQHRFGVNQRSILQNKGVMSDVLYMSATPIPRTYALTIYGDMDTSILKAKPAGRKEIITKVKKEKELKEVLSHMYQEVKKGHQIYVVAPLIEENEDTPEGMNDVLKLKRNMEVAFKEHANVEILHGKMKNEEKEQVMRDFKDGKITILISTTVIEVGIDVKNATMMVIFNAERFGLATLHQLRGRVGRNELQSYCYLICNQEKERLKVMEESNDGFYISEKDFEMRGEGDLFGVRQSGDMIFKVGNIKHDYKILMQAKKDATLFLEKNIETKFAKYPYYRELLKQIDFID